MPVTDPHFYSNLEAVMHHLAKWITMSFFMLILLPAPAPAQDVQPGFDILVHQDPSGWDFGPQPLPADFFGPGSDPFDGIIALKGDPLGSSPLCPGDLGLADMIILRKNVAVLPGIPSDFIIDVEIVELSLVSVAPITVSYNGGAYTEDWNVEMTISPSAPSEGSMIITKFDPGGGAFDASIILRPHFTFTRVSDSFTLTLDGAGTYDDIVECIGGGWVYEAPPLECPPCAANFIPGQLPGGGEYPFDLSGYLSTNTLVSACTINTPTLSQWGMISIVLLMVTAGILYMHRRRKAAVRT
jgi:hypothetical protein